MSVQWIDYKGHKIVYVDYRGLNINQLIGNLEKAYELITASPEKKLVLTNMENVYVNKVYMDRAKELTMQSGESKVLKTAIVGIDGLKGLLLLGYNTITHAHMKSFTSEDEAKEWLIQS